MPKRLLRVAEVMDRCGFKRTTLHRLVKRDDFPKPVMLTNRAVAWLESDVEEWIESRHEAIVG